MKKNILSIFLLLSIALNCICVAAEGEASIAFAVPVNSNAVFGETAEIPINITHNNGTSSFIIELAYDADVLTPTAVTRTSGALSDFMMASNLNYTAQGDNRVRIVMAGANNSSYTGEIVRVSFSVSRSTSKASSPLTLYPTQIFSTYSGETELSSSKSDGLLLAYPVKVDVNNMELTENGLSFNVTASNNKSATQSAILYIGLYKNRENDTARLVKCRAIQTELSAYGENGAAFNTADVISDITSENCDYAKVFVWKNTGLEELEPLARCMTTVLTGN